MKRFPNCGCVRNTPCELCPGHVVGSEKEWRNPPLVIDSLWIYPDEGKIHIASSDIRALRRVVRRVDLFDNGSIKMRRP